LKGELVEKYGPKCNIYMQSFPIRELQIDHRIPFEIAGDSVDSSNNIEEYMLLCASANRSKSWSCEHCLNWEHKEIATCKACYWAYPELYEHIAMRNVRRIDLLWSDEEITEYNKVIEGAEENQIDAPEYVKTLLRKHFENN
jgi:hypothetical protein